MDIIEENNHKSEHFRSDSFIGKLHEEGIVDLSEYYQLEKGMIHLIDQHGHDIPKNMLVRFGIMSTYVLRMMVAHLDKDDSFNIQNVEIEKMYALLNRMHEVFNSVESGLPPDPNSLPEIENS